MTLADELQLHQRMSTADNLQDFGSEVLNVIGHGFQPLPSVAVHHASEDTHGSLGMVHQALSVGTLLVNEHEGLKRGGWVLSYKLPQSHSSYLASNEIQQYGVNAVLRPVSSNIPSFIAKTFGLETTYPYFPWKVLRDGGVGEYGFQ